MKEVIVLTGMIILFSTEIFSATATYFCCKESNDKCFTTNGSVWHTGDYTPCGSTPCTEDKCEKKKVSDSDGIINTRIFVSHDGTQFNGRGYVNTQVFYDESVKSGDFHTTESTIEFQTYQDWLNYITTNP